MRKTSDVVKSGSCWRGKGQRWQGMERVGPRDRQFHPHHPAQEPVPQREGGASQREGQQPKRLLQHREETDDDWGDRRRSSRRRRGEKGRDEEEMTDEQLEEEYRRLRRAREKRKRERQAERTRGEGSPAAMEEGRGGAHEQAAREAKAILHRAGYGPRGDPDSDGRADPANGTLHAELAAPKMVRQMSLVRTPARPPTRSPQGGWRYTCVATADPAQGTVPRRAGAPAGEAPRQEPAHPPGVDP
jgi:hypothetical protein